ncbi:protein piccolo-like isoform X3 [Lathamus discolor]|uniref:protein piccolo-like isoform X3 n=1 Tax=Lathamus discolor TaxID=678569 RepID=UPI0032B764D4
MALADHLLLILLILPVAPQAAAAPWRARRADEDGGKAQGATWQDAGLVPIATLAQPGDPLQANSFLDPSADLLPKPESNPRGMEQEAVQSEAAAGAHSISGPVSTQDTVAMQDTDMRALSRPGKDQHGRVYGFYPLDSVQQTAWKLVAAPGDSAAGPSKTSPMGAGPSKPSPLTAGPSKSSPLRAGPSKPSPESWTIQPITPESWTIQTIT